MCEHTRCLSGLWGASVEHPGVPPEAGNEGTDVIGVHLAILDCHSCSENRSQQPEGGSGRQGGLVCMEMERSRRYGPDTGASWVRPTPSCYDLLMLLEPVMC